MRLHIVSNHDMKRLHVLVAEDDPDIRHMVVTGLRCDGYEVVEANDGAQLLDRVASSMLFGEAEPPDIIVSDVRMPGFSGLTVLSGLRSAGWTTPIILITAYGSEEVRKHAFDLGATALLEKPFDVDDLRTAVMNLAPVSALRYKWYARDRS
jgi:CheY-like chemotaxis protein